MRRLIAFLVLLASPLHAEGQPAGEFDYYVLALSWSPSWCALEGDRRGAEQCETDAGWTLHGLWPQRERGWPSFCRTAARDPSRGMTGEMADIMGSSGLAWHQWKKHGRCTGLEAGDFFRLSRLAYERVTRPAILRKVSKPMRLPPSVIEEAFLEANPALSADGITITCRGGRIQEARVCLTRDLEPRRCGADVIRDCAHDAVLEPVR